MNESKTPAQNNKRQDMRLYFHLKLMFVMMIIFGVQDVSAQTTDLQGQLSGWIYIDESSLSKGQFGFRYIPALSLEKYIDDEMVIDSELSANVFGWAGFDAVERIDENSDLKAYRLWLRLSASQYELRIGLQKINFGTAKLLRPLMWFDRIDPRDPLKLTDGVYGLLGRYYLLNNANIWLWGLYGNDETKGWEAIPTDKKSIEFGGRCQYPLGSGEIALSYHRRQIDLEQSKATETISGDRVVPENRFALDGNWDLGVGLWFENVWIRQNSSVLPFKYGNFFTIGSDYTFSVGNGLHVMIEHLLSIQTDKPFGSDERFNYSAWSMDYNLGLLDRLSAIVYYDWEGNRFSRFAGWSRIYDNWSFYLNAFWNHEENDTFGFQGDSRGGVGFGKGLQIMAVFNH